MTLEIFSFFLVCRSIFFFFFSSRRRHTRLVGDWSFRRVLFRSAPAGVGAPRVVHGARPHDGRRRSGARRVKVLITGADGFVGPWLVRRLLDDGRVLFRSVRPAAGSDDGFTPEERSAVRWLPLELTDPESVRQCVALPYDAVVHLAAVASGMDAGRDPGYAWMVNATGTARVAQALAEAKLAGRADPLLLVASTAEVYGRGDPQPRRETDPVAPCSPYAASKLGAEIAALEAWRRAGLRVVIVRPFAHTDR